MISPRRPCACRGVGWVERSETHRRSRQIRRALVAKMADYAWLVRLTRWLSKAGSSSFHPFVARMSVATCGTLEPRMSLRSSGLRLLWCIVRRREFRQEHRMSDVPPYRLGGEADPNAWHFSRLGEEGPLPKSYWTYLSLLTHDTEGRWRLVGTRFYVNDGGLFVTARHVIEEVCREADPAMPLLIMHLAFAVRIILALQNAVSLDARVGQCWTSDTADVALGAAATATDKIRNNE